MKRKKNEELEAGMDEQKKKRRQKNMKIEDHDVVIMHHDVARGRFSTNKLTWRIWDIHEDHDVVTVNHVVVSIYIATIYIWSLGRMCRLLTDFLRRTVNKNLWKLRRRSRISWSSRVEEDLEEFHIDLIGLVIILMSSLYCMDFVCFFAIMSG